MPEERKTGGKNGRRKEIRNKKMLNSGECVETQTRSKQKNKYPIHIRVVQNVSWCM